MLQHCGTATIETERLILRPFTLNDAEDAFLNWAGDPAVQIMYSEPVYETKHRVAELLARYISNYAKLDYYRWAVILKESQACIGQIAYFEVNSKNHFAEMEYCISRPLWNQGYATEAAKAVIAYGFEQINLHKVQICHKSINPASGKVIQKCGLSYDGTLRDYFYMDGKYVDRVYYSILQDEWKQKNNLEVMG